MEAIRLAVPTLLLVLVYLVGINVLGAWLGRGQKDARDYFLGSHAMPWGAVLASIVATETSALTFLSIPGDAYSSGYTFLQLVFGYIVGRFAVSGLLLPAYFQREIPTAYALLEARFGTRARRFTSLLFMVTRALAAAVRLAVPAIPIALILNIPVWAAILLLAAGTTVYTLLGGIKADIWIDAIQVFQYLTGALIVLFFLLSRVPGGLSGRPRATRGGRRSGAPLRLLPRPVAPLHVLGGAARRRLPDDGEPRRRPAHRAAAAGLPRVEGRAEGSDRKRVRRLDPDDACS